MKIPTLIALIVITLGCGSRTPRETVDPVIKFGTISAREEIDLDQVKSDKRVNTSVGVSVSSGGGLSIGLGFLLSPFFSSDSGDEAMRYEVDLIDGESLTIYHESRNFEVGDCVRVGLRSDDSEQAPTMERSRDGC